MRRSGFTLLEAVVALAIVGTVAIGALEAYAAEARAATLARGSAPAAALASERMARLELLDVHALRTLPESLSRGRLSAGSIPYEWTAGARAVNGEPDLYELSVDVRWPDGAVALRGRSYRPPLVTRGFGATP
jgi:prepilin-type N-terminal cleavage/methylation domain-containing protein